MIFSEDARLLGLTPSLLTSLRRSLDRVLGDSAAQLLQEAGFTAGGDVYEAFKMWLAQKTDLRDPQDLDSDLLEEMLSGFFDETGWGTLSLERIGSALAVDSNDWAEAEPDSRLPIASCNVSTGILAALFGKLAGGTVSVMEVECRSRGDRSCRFLVGSNETLDAVFNAITQGQGYKEVLSPSN
jgi:predicted hydrocarbon binding protein